MTTQAIIEKMTFYDIVTLIVPGALLCCANQWYPYANDISWLGYIALFGVVLMIGLILKCLGIWWSGFWFRNNTRMIQIAEGKEQGKWQDFVCTFFCAPLMYLFSLFSKLWYTQDEYIVNHYYKQYDIAYNNTYSGHRIEFLENQVAFLQSWSWALGACLVTMIFHKWDLPLFKQIYIPVDWWVVCLFIYASIVAMIILQKKIYSVVWDATEPNEDIQKNQQTNIKEEGTTNENRLKAFFWLLCAIVGGMILFFIYQIGRHCCLSTSPTDYAEFSTYLGAIGTMLFTALYAYAFIHLQGAVNKGVLAQNESNAIAKQKDGEQNVKKNMAILIMTTENTINSCLETLKSVGTYTKEKKLSDDHHSKLSGQLSQALQYIALVNHYYTENRIYPVPDSHNRFVYNIKNLQNNIEQCIIIADQWNAQGHDIRYRSSIRKLLNQSVNCAMQLKMMLMSSML